MEITSKTLLNVKLYKWLPIKHLKLIYHLYNTFLKKDGKYDKYKEL